ncbi:MAG: phosphotransferase [Bacillota bacterium]|nr:phosphotransferase [Bacillota bacterium]
MAKKAFVLGVPTAISYDIVECDGRLGVVYELIKSKTLGELIRNNPENLDEYIAMYVDVCKSIHEIEAKPNSLPSFKSINEVDIGNVTDISEEEREILYDFLNMVPESNHCVHGDLNMNNIMVENGKCLLIDMGEFSQGTYLWDISRLLFSLEFAFEGGEINSFYKMPHALVKKTYEGLFKAYFGVDDLSKIEEVDPNARWLYPMAWFRSITSMLKGQRWSEEKRNLAKHLLRDKLIPFYKKEKGE